MYLMLYFIQNLVAFHASHNKFSMSLRRQLQEAAPQLKVNQDNISFIITCASLDFILSASED